MKKKEFALTVIKKLEELYPDASCQLNYGKPYELLFAARLSAQCTDARVNMITPALFEKYVSLQAFADSDLDELSNDIYSCGFYKTKAVNIKDCAIKLLHDFNGQLPQTVEELVTLPGVGRKTANLIMGDIFGKPAYVTDTHCIRISNRLGFTDTHVPHKVEMDLREVIPPEFSSDFCHRLVMFGREYCKSKSPKCRECVFNKKCTFYNNQLIC